MKLNLGCGSKKLPGWVNVDQFAGCQPDQVVDLEQVPWPWPESSVDEIQMIHVLEHLGKTSDSFLAIIKELWRVCKHDARIFIEVPHPRHDSFLADPTHVRPITITGMGMFSQATNRQWQAEGYANTPLGLILGIDLVLEKSEIKLDRHWEQRLKKGEVSKAVLADAVRHQFNVVELITMVLRVIKPAGGTS